MNFRPWSFWGGGVRGEGTCGAAQQCLVGRVLNAQGLALKALDKHKVLINLSVCFLLTHSCWFCFGCPWGGWWEASCGCLVVFNFNSFGNVAKAFSTSVVTGTQMLQANHSLVFWLSPQWAKLEAHRSLRYLRSSEGQGMAPLWQESKGIALFSDGWSEPPDGIGFPWFASMPMGSLVIDRFWDCRHTD